MGNDTMIPMGYHFFAFYSLLFRLRRNSALLCLRCRYEENDCHVYRLSVR
jgi:hypothetical protein